MPPPEKMYSVKNVKPGVSLRRARSILVRMSHYSRLKKMTTTPHATQKRLTRTWYILHVWSMHNNLSIQVLCDIICKNKELERETSILFVIASARYVDSCGFFFFVLRKFNIFCQIQSRNPPNNLPRASLIHHGAPPTVHHGRLQMLQSALTQGQTRHYVASPFPI